MVVKVGVLFITLLTGSFASPTRVNLTLSSPEDDSVDIIGGTPAAEGSAPYMAALLIGEKLETFFCGGSVISRRTVLTAAHCLPRRKPHNGKLDALSEHFGVVVGTNRWQTGGSKYAAANTTRHPGYNRDTLFNDIGVVITVVDIEFTAVVAPVAIGGDFANAGVVARATGWGITRLKPIMNVYVSDVLMELNTTTIDGQKCIDAMKQANITLTVDPNIEICLLNSTNHGMCFGDSGGPAVRVDTKEQIAIVSWGKPCAEGYPDIFTRVSAYKDWIAENAVGAYN